METNLTRNEKIIAGTTVAVITVFFAMFIKVTNSHNQPTSQVETDYNINYKMGKLDETYSEYSLEGREFELTYEGNPQKDKNESKDKLDQKKKDLIAKQKAENKKKEDLKKKQAANQRAQVKTQGLKPSQSQPAGVVAEKFSDDSAYELNGNAPYYATAQAAVDQAKPEQTPEAKENKKSFADWQKQLFANPNTETLSLFIAALKKGDVIESEFQAMAQDLINQTDNKYKALGLMALRSVPSLASLSQLVHLEPAKIAGFQAYVDQSLRAYLLPQNLPFLMQALGTQDKKLVGRALNLLNVNLAKLSQGDASGIIDPRNVRDDQVVSLSMNTYRSLIPSLARLVSLQDQELSALAQQVSNLIQNSNNVAVN